MTLLNAHAGRFLNLPHGRHNPTEFLIATLVVNDSDYLRGPVLGTVPKLLECTSGVISFLRNSRLFFDGATNLSCPSQLVPVGHGGSLK